VDSLIDKILADRSRDLGLNPNHHVLLQVGFYMPRRCNGCITFF
jgi:hypothetical protein